MQSTVQRRLHMRSVQFIDQRSSCTMDVFSKKSVSDVGAWLKEEKFSDSIVQTFQG